jgi:hypothetical protein
MSREGRLRRVVMFDQSDSEKYTEERVHFSKSKDVQQSQNPEQCVRNAPKRPAIA